MRDLTEIELIRLNEFTKNDIEFALIEPTATGLKKSIMDATDPIRLHLNKHNIHNYDQQTQGPGYKVMISAYLLTIGQPLPAIASLYRPISKKGDPRIWFTGLKKYANPNDIIAILIFQKKFYLINITRIDLVKVLSNQQSHIYKLFKEINNDSNVIANELLDKLRNIAQRGLIAADLDADTAIGRTLERLLDIPINSSKQPDYKGIEIKSFRSNKVNRKNLFAQVPEWKESICKSSAEVLHQHGYHRKDDFKLYCTVSTQNKNSQGLSLKLDLDKGRLYEFAYDEANWFIVWDLKKLHERLLEKHNETFWIEAKSKRINGQEYFEFISVTHTKKPISAQFDVLLQLGHITLDHLIKKDSNGKVVEKGPLFKISSRGIDLLFPPNVKYILKRG